MAYDEYEEQAEVERKKNEEILQLFIDWLSKSGLKEKTIYKHSDNVLFYINEYLLYEEAIPASEGIAHIDDYFNWFFPRKAMWSSVASTKETITSLKKFYKFMSEEGLIEFDDFEFLLNEIKSNKEEWLSHYDQNYEW